MLTSLDASLFPRSAKVLTSGGHRFESLEDLFEAWQKLYHEHVAKACSVSPCLSRPDSGLSKYFFMNEAP